MTVKSLQLPITGITCAACAARIERGVSKLSGILQAEVNRATNALTVKYDPSSIGPGRLIKAISDIGYEVKVQKTTLPVEGMHCASCVRRIEGGLESLDGVLTAEVNFAANTAMVTYLGDRMKPADLKTAIEKIGYAVPDVSIEETHAHHHAHGGSDFRTRLIVALILTIPILIGSLHHLLRLNVGILANPYLLWALATPVQFWAALPFYRGSWAAAKQRASDMNTLIAVGSSAAYLYSAALILFPSFFASARGVERMMYFDTSAVIITLILLGEYLETTSRERASDAIRKLAALRPKTARVARDGEETDVPVEELRVDDIVVVRPGERIATDGIVVTGTSVVDESIVTGESIPVTKEPGSEVIGGAMNSTGGFRFKVTRVGNDTALAQIIRMVEEAQGSKAPVQRLADKVSAYFVPAVILIAIATFIIWYLFGPEPRLSYALLNFVAVLIVACPCALGLATPTAIIVGTGKGAERGILIKGGEALEIARHLTFVVLDKTGTLTMGKPDVTDIIAVDGASETEVLRLAASAERGSEHPLAEAILRAAKEKELSLDEPADFVAQAGHGVEATLNGRRIVVGSGRLVKAKGELTESVAAMEADGKTVVYVAVDGEVTGAIACADRLKPDAPGVVAALKKQGLKVALVTGDNERAAHSLAAQAGISEVLARALPQDKADYVRKLREQGEVVAMVGDGINDSPALAQADVGVAIGAGTDVAMEASDITLIGDDLSGLLTAIRLSRRTMQIAMQNLFWAFVYNVLLIPMAAGALYPMFRVFLNPMLAAAAMAFSSVTVVSNSLRLKRFR